ncbi:MAG: 50S ribosomal protein L21 [Deferribacterota bacterium]|nr:50S ribosomal protein L21 [Deferribacterota bacterium]
MECIVANGSKQYIVKEGDIIDIEKIPGEVGARAKLEDVVLAKKDDDVLIGKPLLKNSYVEAEIIDQYKSKKIVVFKKKRRKGYSKKLGHRQNYTKIKIDRINIGEE